MIDCLKSCATALTYLRLSVHGEEEKKFAQCVLWLLVVGNSPSFSSGRIAEELTWAVSNIHYHYNIMSYEIVAYIMTL